MEKEENWHEPDVQQMRPLLVGNEILNVHHQRLLREQMHRIGPSAAVLATRDARVSFLLQGQQALVDPRPRRSPDAAGRRSVIVGGVVVPEQ